MSCVQLLDKQNPFVGHAAGPANGVAREHHHHRVASTGGVWERVPLACLGECLLTKKLPTGSVSYTHLTLPTSHNV